MVREIFGTLYRVGVSVGLNRALGGSKVASGTQEPGLKPLISKFACGLGAAKSLRPQNDGGVLITDGPYLETKEHIGGFWIVECADMDQAVAWARKGVFATRGQVEVREIFFQPAPEEA